jgi:O-antigen ligase
MAGATELICLASLLSYLVWLPMPFGSIVPRAYGPLVLPPLLICGIVSFLRARSPRRIDRPRALVVWTIGATAFLVLVGMQLAPLPPAVLAMVSPQSSSIWARADAVGKRAGLGTPAANHPITVDPEATSREFFRLMALLATFEAAALLIVGRRRRIAFSVALMAGASFEALYGARQAALRRYEIWGWPNTLIFDRVSGTYVNPNHYAHYLAITLPMVAYLGVSMMGRARGSGVPLHRRLASLVEKNVLLIGVAVLVAGASGAAILLSQSRGAMLALAAGFSLLGGAVGFHYGRTARGRKWRLSRVIPAVVATLLALGIIAGAMAVYIGRERTVARFGTLSSDRAMGGRRAEIAAGVQIWRRFPWFGSGAGTFQSVVSLAQREDLDLVYQHAHDDYVELGATTGLIGFLIALTTLCSGLILLLHKSFAAESASRRLRLFPLLTATSIVIAAIHALYDFNFFMPANAATIAAIAGAAAAIGFKEPATQSSAGVPARHS